MEFTPFWVEYFFSLGKGFAMTKKKKVFMSLKPGEVRDDWRHWFWCKSSLYNLDAVLLHTIIDNWNGGSGVKLWILSRFNSLDLWRCWPVVNA